MDAINKEPSKVAENPESKVQKQYQAPLLTELGSLATLSRTDVILSVGGG